MLSETYRTFVTFTVLLTVIALIAFIYSTWLLFRTMDETLAVETRTFEVDEGPGELLTAQDTVVNLTGLKNPKVVPIHLTTGGGIAQNYPSLAGAQTLYTAPTGRRGFVYPIISLVNTTGSLIRYLWGVVDKDNIPYGIVGGNINANSVGTVGFSRYIHIICNAGGRVVVWGLPGIRIHATVLEYDEVEGQPQGFGLVLTDTSDTVWSPPEGKVFVKYFSDAARESWGTFTHTDNTNMVYIEQWLNQVYMQKSPAGTGFFSVGPLQAGWKEGTLGTIIESKDELRTRVYAHGPPLYAPPQPTVPTSGYCTLYFTGSLIDQ